MQLRHTSAKFIQYVKNKKLVFVVILALVCLFCVKTYFYNINIPSNSNSVFNTDTNNNSVFNTDTNSNSVFDTDTNSNSVFNTDTNSNSVFDTDTNSNSVFDTDTNSNSVFDIDNRQCPNVLGNMLNGVWKQKPMTLKETRDMELFLDYARMQHGLNKTLQRNDLKCGNVSFAHQVHPNGQWFRGLCDMKGETPCCFNNHCVNKSTQQCRCKDCYDMRQYVHAEYSDFIPKDPRCQIKQFNYLEACDLLTNGTIAFLGDSYLRHIYTAVLLFLRNNFIDGAMRKNVTKEINDQCTGMYMFTEKVCRLNLDQWKTSDICGGKVNLLFRYFYSYKFGSQVTDIIQKQLYNKSRSLLIFGVGLHDDFDTNKIKSKLINPVHQLSKTSKWPKLLWATPHQPGILKNGNIVSQSKAKVKTFISRMDNILTPLNIPQFNTYNMTDGIMSFDGNHYGLGANMWKLQILLNYIQELKNNGQW